MKLLSWDISREDFATLKKVVERVHWHPANKAYKRQDLMMDLNACHSNGCPLDFEKLLGFSEFDFAHDIWGIRRHLNRETGELMDCFLPRCAAHEQEAEVQLTNTSCEGGEAAGQGAGS